MTWILSQFQRYVERRGTESVARRIVLIFLFFLVKK